MQATFVRYSIDLRIELSRNFWKLFETVDRKRLDSDLKIYASVLPTVGNDNYGFLLNEQIDKNNGTEGNNFITDT